jgi:hypothetical protein
MVFAIGCQLYAPAGRSLVVELCTFPAHEDEWTILGAMGSGLRLFGMEYWVPFYMYRCEIAGRRIGVFTWRSEHDTYNFTFYIEEDSTTTFNEMLLYILGGFCGQDQQTLFYRLHIGGPHTKRTDRLCRL